MQENNNHFDISIQEPLIRFINSVVNSYIAWDIITYLQMGSEKKIATIDEISDSIGRDKKDILPVIDLFINNGYIEKQEKFNKPFYSITSDKEKEAQVNDFIWFAHTREGRLKIIYFITKYRMEH